MAYGDLLSEAIRRNNALLVSIEEAEGKLKEKNKVPFTEGVTQINIYHGLHSILKIPISFTCDEMVFSPRASEYLLLIPKKHVVRFDCLGRQLGMNYPLEGTEFTRVMWAYRLGLFLCWQPESYIIYICKKDFTLVHMIESEAVLQNLLYDENTKEIFAVGKQLISVYRYHEGSGKLDIRGQIKFQCTDSTLTYIQNCDLASVQGVFQRIYASYFGGVYVVDVYEKRVTDSRKSLHSSHITAMLFYKEVMWLITGDALGTVKCWDLEWKLLMVFVGHEGTITHLLPHPGLCGFITSGHDQCLTAWSCALRDKVEKIRLRGRAKAISLNWKEKSIAVLSNIVEVWRMHKLYDFHSALSAPPTMLYTAMNPCYPCRTIVLCADSSVRLISPVTGEQLTVQISPAFMKVEHAGYSSHSDILYTSVNYKNRIIVSYCDENPVKFWKAWRFQGSYVPTVTSLAVFEHIARDRNLIKGVVDPHQRKSIWKMFQTKSTVLFLGREDGTIASPHATDGYIQSCTEAHDCPVTILTANMRRMQLVSCGVDNVIKVWRVFPYLTSGPLLLLACIYYSHNFPISFVTTLHDVLCLGATGDNTVSHVIVMYDFCEKVRYDHPPKHDHSMTITSMTSNDYLALCATASLDGTIRIWNEINELEKILELNAIPSLLSYSSRRGDITLAIGKHLYKIPYERYLSPKYRYKIEAYDIPDAYIEKAMPFTKENLYDVSAEEEDLVYPCVSMPLFLKTAPSGQPPSSEEVALKQLEYCRIDARNTDIQNIIEGNFEVPTRIPPHRIIGSRSWRMLIQNILSAPVEEKKPDQADMNIKELRRRQSRKLRCLNLQVKFKARYGQSYTELTQVSNLSFDPLGTSPPVAYGFLPNSVLFKLFDIMSGRETGDSEAQRIADAEREKFGNLIRREFLLKLLQVPEDQKFSLRKKKSRRKFQSKRSTLSPKSFRKSYKKSTSVGSLRKTTFVRPNIRHFRTPRKERSKIKFKNIKREVVGDQPSLAEIGIAKDERELMLKCESLAGEVEKWKIAEKGDAEQKHKVSMKSEDKLRAKAEQRASLRHGRKSKFKERKVLRFADVHEVKELVEHPQDMLVVPPHEPLLPSSDVKHVKDTRSSEHLSTTKDTPPTSAKDSSYAIAKVPSVKDTTSSQDLSSASSTRDTTSSEDLSSISSTEDTPRTSAKDISYKSLGKEKSLAKVPSVKDTPVMEDKDVSPTRYLPHGDISMLTSGTASPEIELHDENKLLLLDADEKKDLLDEKKDLLPQVGHSKIGSLDGKGDEKRSSVSTEYLAKKLADASKTDIAPLTVAKILYAEQDDLQPLIKETLLRTLYESRNNNKAFKNALNAFKDLNLSDVETVATMLALLMMERKSVKNMVLQYLKELALHDPDGVLPAYLEEWYKEIADKETDFEKTYAAVTAWLLHWMQTLEYHVNQVISQVQDGELTTEIDSAAMHRLEDILDTSLQPGAHYHEDDEQVPLIDGDRSPPPDIVDAGEMMDQVGSITVKGIQLREQVKLRDISHEKKLLPTIVPHLNDPVTGIPLVLKGAIHRRIVDIDLERNITEMTVVLKPGLKLLPHGRVRPMEAVNYFCELQSRMKQIHMRHLDACISDIHIFPEDKASPSMKSHLPWKTHLHRPMSTVFPNPFNSRTAYPGPVLLTLKTSYKYFCPKASVP